MITRRHILAAGGGGLATLAIPSLLRAQQVEPVGGLRTQIEIQGGEHDWCYDVIGEKSDPVRSFRVDA